MKTVWIDGRLYRELSDIYRVLERELSFPDYFGHNLDALHDVLCEISADTEIYVTRKNELVKNLEKASALLLVFGDSARENPHLRVLILD